MSTALGDRRKGGGLSDSCRSGVPRGEGSGVGVRVWGQGRSPGLEELGAGWRGGVGRGAHRQATEAEGVRVPATQKTEPGLEAWKVLQVGTTSAHTEGCRAPVSLAVTFWTFI